MELQYTYSIQVSDARYGLAALCTVLRKAATKLAPVRQNPRKQPVVVLGSSSHWRNRRSAPGPVTLLAAPAGLETRPRKRSPLRVGQLGRVRHGTVTKRQPRRSCFAAAFAELHESALFVFLTISTRGAAKNTSPSQSSASRTPHDSLAVKRSSDARHAQRRRPVGPRPAGPSPQVHHPEPVRPGETASEPQEPALRRLPEAKDGLRDPLGASL